MPETPFVSPAQRIADYVEGLASEIRATAQPLEDQLRAFSNAIDVDANAFMPRVHAAIADGDYAGASEAFRTLAMFFGNAAVCLKRWSDIAMKEGEETAAASCLEAGFERFEAAGRFMFGQCELQRGTHHRLRGSPDVALQAYLSSVDSLAMVPMTSEVGDKAAVLKRVGLYGADIARAQQRLLLTDMDGAESLVLEARAGASALLSSDAVRQLNDPAIAGWIEADVTSIRAMCEQISLLGSVLNGQYSAALMAADRQVELLQRTAKLLSETDASPALRKLLGVQRLNCLGYRDYIQAEISVDEARWSEGERLLDSARVNWSEAAAESIALGTVEGRSLADNIRPIAMVFLQMARRRARRERELVERISRLEGQLNTQVVVQQGDYNVTGGGSITQVGDRGEVNRSVQAIESRSTVLVGAEAFGRLWQEFQGSVSLPQVAEGLERVLADTRLTRPPSVSSEQVEAAEEALVASRAADGPKTLEYLKSAGKWVLDSATKIGVTVATEAMKKALWP